MRTSSFSQFYRFKQSSTLSGVDVKVFKAVRNMRDRASGLAQSRQKWLLPLSPDDSHIARFVCSWTFTTIVSLIIVLTSFNTGLQTDNEARKELRPSSSEVPSVTVTDVLRASRKVDEFFCWLFLCEVLLRVWAERLDFVLGEELNWNLFDSVLLVVSFSERYANLRVFAFTRKLRMLRIIRVIKVLKMFRAFDVLRRMVSSILTSLLSVTWVVIVLLLMMYMFSLYFIEAAVMHVQTNTEDGHPVNDDLLALLHQYFGTIGRSMLSLFMAISGGTDWGDVSEALWSLGWAPPFVFLAFIVFMLFAVVNIVTGIFVEQASRLAEVDRDMIMRQEVEAQREVSRDIEAFFRTIDIDGNGTLTWTEFKGSLRHKKVLAYFEHLGIDADNARQVFVLLDRHRTGQVPIEAFVDGCMRLRGPAKSIDMAVLLNESKKSREAMETLAHGLGAIARPSHSGDTEMRHISFA